MIPDGGERGGERKETKLINYSFWINENHSIIIAHNYGG